MKRLLLVLLCAIPASATQVATPTFLYGTGTYINDVAEVVVTATASATICWAFNAVPTATVAGTCDGNKEALVIDVVTSGTVLEVIGTEAGFTNSAVATATYTITTLNQPAPLLSYGASWIVTPAVAGTITNGNPTMMQAGNGKVLLFYSQCPTGSSDSFSACATLLQTCTTNCGTSGATWTGWGDASQCGGASPPTNCFFRTNAVISDIPTGGGCEPAPSLNCVIWGAEFSGVNNQSYGGAWWRYTSDGGTTWSVPAFLLGGQAQNFWVNPTAQTVFVPANSLGVTGPGTCATTGCWIQSVLGTPAGGGIYITYSYDKGHTWSNPVGTGFSFSAEEVALTWIGGLTGLSGDGMKLMVLIRTVDANFPNGPTPAQFSISSDLGQTWQTEPSPNHSVPYASNFFLTPCSTYPNTGDQFTRPSVVVAPQGGGAITYFMGERFACNGTAPVFWRAVTVNASSLFTANGQNFPIPQALGLYGPLTNNATTSMPHNGYSTVIVLNSTQLLVAFEQGQGGGSGTGNEDIRCVVLTYYTPQNPNPAPTTFAELRGNVSFSGGVKIQ